MGLEPLGPSQSPRLCISSTPEVSPARPHLAPGSSSWSGSQGTEAGCYLKCHLCEEDELVPLKEPAGRVHEHRVGDLVCQVNHTLFDLVGGCRLLDGLLEHHIEGLGVSPEAGAWGQPLSLLHAAHAGSGWFPLGLGVRGPCLDPHSLGWCWSDLAPQLPPLTATCSPDPEGCSPDPEGPSPGLEAAAP